MTEQNQTKSDEKIQVSTVEARQGVTNTGARWVLVVSLVVAALALAGVAVAVA